MSKSRLPPPPSRGRPLPPKPPSEGNDEDAPPPLPSRPTGGGGGGKPPPPSFRQPPPPAVNGQSPENSDEESYTEPDLPPPVSRHPPPKSKPPEPEPEPGQETYDDLDEPESPESTDSEEECEPGQETYDQCDIKEADEGMTYEMEPDCVYEAEPPVEEHPPPPSPIEESTYEFVPEDSMHTPPPPSRPAVPAPPDSVPSLPARPPPSRPMDSSSSGDSAPELPPGRPPPTPTNKVVRKVPGDGPQMPGISLGDISEKRANLRKFSAAMSAEVPEEPKPVVIPGDASSVKDRINMFKQVEKEDPDSLDESSLDESSVDDSFQAQISRARLSLRKRLDNQIQSANVVPTSKTKEARMLPSDSTNLSVQERIARMSRKSGVLEIKPPVPIKPVPPLRPKPQDTPVNFKANLKPVMPGRETTVDSKAPFKSLRPAPPIKPPKEIGQQVLQGQSQPVFQGQDIFQGKSNITVQQTPSVSSGFPKSPQKPVPKPGVVNSTQNTSSSNSLSVPEVGLARPYSPPKSFQHVPASHTDVQQFSQDWSSSTVNQEFRQPNFIPQAVVKYQIMSIFQGMKPCCNQIP